MVASFLYTLTFAIKLSLGDIEKYNYFLLFLVKIVIN